MCLIKNSDNYAIAKITELRRESALRKEFD